MANKLFESNASLKQSSMVSKVRVNREYLISKNTAQELNTYISFNPFPTFNDLFAPEYSKDGKKDITPDSRGSGTLGVRSLFNRAGAVIIGDVCPKLDPNDPNSPYEADFISYVASDWRISNNVPLMDNRATRTAIKANSGCTVKDLVKASEEGLLGREIYSFSDFMFCKYLGRVSNNYLITLRRFPYPVDDFIASMGVGDDRTNKYYTTTNADSIGCLVTWMGTPGNDMSNILKYSVSMPFKIQNAQMQNSEINADSQSKPFNAIAAVFDTKYRQQYMAGQAGPAVNEYMNKFFPIPGGYGDPPYPAREWNNYEDNAKVYGPVDTIKTTYMRSNEGLNFNQTITITFDYELRAYNGINGRQAMLDLLANILNVTYSTGTFWGGGFRGGGAHQNNIFTNMQIFKQNKNGITDFIDAFSQDAKTLSGGISGYIKSNGGFFNTIKSLANQLGGMVLAGFLNNMGRPNKQTANSLLSPAPVGFWHLTIGNPHHPIMSIGNMILKNTTIEHYGPLGLDDFPTGIRVTCELERGKSRDIRDIEKLYMHGNDRIYSPMGPKIFDMYTHSKEYKSGYKARNVVNADGNANTDITVASSKKVSVQDFGKMQHVLQKYFGHADTKSIMVASMEQEMGAHKKTKKGTAGGDSTEQGNR